MSSSLAELEAEEFEDAAGFEPKLEDDEVSWLIYQRTRNSMLGESDWQKAETPAHRLRVRHAEKCAS
jgi:hypothetical protein